MWSVELFYERETDILEKGDRGRRAPGLVASAYKVRKPSIESTWTGAMTVGGREGSSDNNSVIHACKEFFVSFECEGDCFTQQKSLGSQ